MISTKLLNRSDKDSFLLLCFKHYCCKNITIDKAIYTSGIKDMNDYKTIAAIGYLLISNNKWDYVLNDFKDGLSRICKKDIKSYTLIYDQLALIGIAIAIKEYQVTKYYQWLHNVLFEAEAYCMNSSKDTIFIKILRAYFDEQPYPEVVEFKYNVLIIWLSTFSEENKNTYKEQAELLQRVWKCEGYLFDDIFYNGICAFLVDLLIQDKFEFGIIPVEQKYKNAVKHCKRIAKNRAVVITVTIVLIIVSLTVLLLYLIWSYYREDINRKMWYIPIIINTLSIIEYLYKPIKKIKKTYTYIDEKIFRYIMKLRRLD